jgi:hypothetical protein
MIGAIPETPLLGGDMTMKNMLSLFSLLSYTFGMPLIMLGSAPSLQTLAAFYEILDYAGIALLGLGFTAMAIMFNKGSRGAECDAKFAHIALLIISAACYSTYIWYIQDECTVLKELAIDYTFTEQTGTPRSVIKIIQTEGMDAIEALLAQIDGMQVLAAPFDTIEMIKPSRFATVELISIIGRAKIAAFVP